MSKQTKEEKLAYSRKYHQDNKEAITARQRKYHKENRDKILERKALHQQQPEVKAKRAKRHRDRRKVDINFVLQDRLRSRINYALRNNQKVGSAVQDLGCTIDEFKIYIENQFTEGMSWDNRDEWHLDHIIPLSYFNLENREEFLKACHYSNYQPLWAEDNLSKSNKILA